MRYLLLRCLLVAVALAVVVSPPPPSGYTGPIPSEAALSADALWNLDAIGAPAAWKHTRGRGITVAVLDSGVALDHPDLSRQISAGVDCTGSGGDPQRCSGLGMDGNGHGTHVAGIIAARPQEEDGLTGVAPEARLLAVRVLDDGCLDAGCVATGETVDVIAGIRWAVEHDADVINLSLVTTGGKPIDSGLSQAISDAWGEGVIVVTAGGNEEDHVGLGDLPVLVVAGLDRTGHLAAYSHGIGDSRWGIAAPGGQSGDTSQTCSRRGHPVGVLSTWWSPDEAEGYGCLSGTSMAAPHVSGAAALLLSMGLSPEQVVTRLLDTATDFGTPGFDRFYGAGALDVARAVDPDRAPSPGSERFIAAASPDTAVRSSDLPSSEGEQRPVPVLVMVLSALAAAAIVAAWLGASSKSGQEKNPV